MRLTFLLGVRQDGLVHAPVISKENAKDPAFLKYVRDHLVPNLRAGDTVISDRLGRSGRALIAMKQRGYIIASLGRLEQRETADLTMICLPDYNPAEAKRLIEEAGCRLLFLPPKGKHFNPIVVVFGKIRTHIHNSYTRSLAAREKDIVQKSSFGWRSRLDVLA